MKNPHGLRGMPQETKTYTATEARTKFADLFDAAHFGECVVVKKRDRCVAIVSMEMLARAEKALQAEAQAEAEAARAALKEFHAKGGKTLEDLEKELGMD